MRERKKKIKRRQMHNRPLSRMIESKDLKKKQKKNQNTARDFNDHQTRQKKKKENKWQNERLQLQNYNHSCHQ